MDPHIAVVAAFLGGAGFALSIQMALRSLAQRWGGVLPPRRRDLGAELARLNPGRPEVAEEAEQWLERYVLENPPGHRSDEPGDS